MPNEEFIKEYFKNNEVTITLHPETTEKKFDNVQDLSNFVQSEVEQWKIVANINPLSTIYNTFFQTYQELINAQSNNYNAEVSLKSAISRLKTETKSIVFSQTAVGKQLINVIQTNESEASGIFEYKIKKQIDYSKLSNIGYFKGVLQSYAENDLKIAATEEIVNQRNSLESLHKEYEEKIEEAHKDFKDKSTTSTTELDILKTDIKSWQGDVKKDTKEFIDDKVSEYEQLKKQIEELEKLYKEKLRLSAATKYWNELSQEYKDKGKMWTTISGIASAIFIIFLSFILYNIPTILSDSNKGKVTLGNVRGTLIFALIASIGVYLIHLFIKLVLSSYHLSRDAREREQLTYVYLALINEKAINEQDRNVVLQALFSRADTGLLKGDSSPTLPDGTISQILKNIKG